MYRKYRMYRMYRMYRYINSIDISHIKTIIYKSVIDYMFPFNENDFNSVHK